MHRERSDGREGDAGHEEVTTARAPRAAVLGSLGISTVGLAIAAYLTVEHFNASTTLACPESATVNCLKVTTSSYSSLLGVPVAVLGLVFFAAMLGLCLPGVWAVNGLLGRWVRLARVTAATGGVGFALYLIWAELFAIGAICLWCTAVHVAAVALFAVIAIGTASLSAPEA